MPLQETLSFCALLVLLAAAPALHAQSSPLDSAHDNPMSNSLEGTPAPDGISTNEMRSMTAADFERHINAEGAQRFVRRFSRDVDPHSPEEPNYDIVLEHVAEGSNDWLHAAAHIAPYTETVFSQGLRVAIADALVINPVGVLNLMGTEEHFDEACGYPYVHQSDTYLRRHKREALAALTRVRQPGLAAKKENCRKQLMELPTTAASDAGHPAPGTRE